MPDVAAALAFVNDFERNGSQSVAWQIDRAATLARLRTLVQSPELLNQRGLNACGPAVFFRIWLARDPLAAATFGCALLRDGHASIGALSIAPSWKLLGQQYALLRSTTDAAHPNATPEHADWMLLSAMRDSENIWFDYAGEPWTLGDKVAGITLPSSVASWLAATSLYSNVKNDTNLVASAGRQALFGLIPTSNVDIAIFVSANAIYDLRPAPPAGAAAAGPLISVPDHYVLMTGPIAQWNDPSWVEIDVWSWGKPYVGWQSDAVFFGNYFGTIVATV